MKKLLILLLFAGALTSCSKDSLDQEAENFSIAQSEIFVNVTYITWSDLALDLNCTGGGTQFINPMGDAKVKVFSGTEEDTDDTLEERNGLTGKDGSILFKDIVPGQYTILVDGPLGQKSRTVYTQLHKRTSIEFSF